MLLFIGVTSFCRCPSTRAGPGVLMIDWVVPV